MLNNIQALRAFAAINVVLFHVIGISSAYSQGASALEFLRGWGDNGVDVFFVISGFVMLHTQFQKSRSPWEFLKNRVVRIVPLYWLLTLFVVSLLVFLPSVFRGGVPEPLWLASSLLFVSSVVAGKMPVVFLGWTIEWEMFFYVLFAVGLFFRNPRFQIAFVAFVLAAFVAFTGKLIVLDFLLGMLVACVFQQKKLTRFHGMVAFAMGAVLLLASISPAVKALGMNRFVLWGLPSFLLVLGLVHCQQLKSRLLAYLGDASYSIYLVQMLTISGFYKFSSRFLTTWNGNLLAVACLAASVIFGCLVHSFIEKPTTVKLRKVLAQ